MLLECAKVPALSNNDATRLLSSGTLLQETVASVIHYRPEWAIMSSERDASLPLHFAASIGNVPLAKCIFNANRKAAVTPNRKGKIPLHYAAREGRVDIVQFFMEQAPETASILSEKNKSALHFAAGEGHLDVVQVLLEVHPQAATLLSKKGKVAMHFAARWGHVEVARALYQASSESIQILDYEGSSTLHDAAREGQAELMKFLIKNWEEGLQQENLHGEIPLFAAIRSGNLDLVTYMVQAWPASAKIVLQRVGEDEMVASWAPELLQICLRGAVNIWDCGQNEKAVLQTAATRDHDTRTTMEQSVANVLYAMRTSNSATSLASSELSSDEGQTVDESVGTRSLDIHLPRSKSPILSDVTKERIKPRKRSSSMDVLGEDPSKNDTKRMRSETSSSKECGATLSELRATSNHRAFWELHAALECGASATVLQCVLDRYGEAQRTMEDELGRLPLHVAMACPPTKGQHQAAVTDLVLEQIWKPYPEACFQRDFLGRLPLHHGLMSRCSPRLIKAVLESHPSSAVEYCEILDARFMEATPLDMAMACQCHLSSIYMLVRADPNLPSAAGWLRGTQDQDDQVSTTRL